MGFLTGDMCCPWACLFEPGLGQCMGVWTTVYSGHRRLCEKERFGPLRGSNENSFCNYSSEERIGNDCISKEKGIRFSVARVDESKIPKTHMGGEMFACVTHEPHWWKDFKDAIGRRQEVYLCAPASCRSSRGSGRPSSGCRSPGNPQAGLQATSTVPIVLVTPIIPHDNSFSFPPFF